MGKNSCRLICIIIASFLFVSSSFAAVLHWSPVDSTSDCVIAGYKVHFGTTYGIYSQVIDVGNVTFCDLDLLPLVQPQTYYFAVNAYSTAHQEGPLSAPVSYTDSPNIADHPFIDHAGKTIDVTFNESNMLGADIKSNYDFSPTLLFADAGIALTERTYRLFMNYIPAYAIITMRVSNVTDSKGLSLLSNAIVLNDNDNDAMADDWEAHYGITLAFSDPDSDGLHNSLEYASGTSPMDKDTDNDGMDDGWEVQNSLNPLLDDASGDIDGDGISNIEEYNGGAEGSNQGPEKPLPSLPFNASPQVSLTPQFVTAPYVDPENDAHGKTQWQISTESSFTFSENILFELETYDSLTTLIVPEFILDPGETYYWRVRFFDIVNSGSVWSDSFSFTTVAINPEDPDGDGVPDLQKVEDGRIDLDNDGYFDVSSTIYKMATNGSISLGLEASNNVAGVDFLKCIDSDDILDTFGKPVGLEFGLIQFKIRVDNTGDTAEIKVYFSEPVGKNWYKYDLMNGWREYSLDYPDYVSFSPDGKSVLLRLVDGGAGDSDGIANGIIVDPSGPGTVTSVSTGASGGGGGCFITTAAAGSFLEKHVQALKEFRIIRFLLLITLAAVGVFRTADRERPHG